MGEHFFDLADLLATERLATALAHVTKQSVVVALNGPLGVGKTKFVQCFARALGVEEVVNSPTFTMMNEYHSGRIPLYHLDLYRLGESEALATVRYLEEELSEILPHPHAILIEWAELLSKQTTGGPAESKIAETKTTEMAQTTEDHQQKRSSRANDDNSETNFLDRLDHLVATFSYNDSYDEVLNENGIIFSSSLYKHQERRRVSIQAAGSNSERLLLVLQEAMSTQADK